MRTTSIFKKLLDVNGLVVVNVEFKDPLWGEPYLLITVRVAKWRQGRCGKCGRRFKHYDVIHEARQWRSLDMGATKVILEMAETERGYCSHCDGIIVAAVPWARHNSRFTKAFEDQTAWLATRASRSVVSQLQRISWNTVGPVTQRVYDELKAKAPDPLDGLTRIGIDETSYKKGHKYITVVVNHEDGSLLWAAQGFGKEVLEPFFQLLGPERCAKIQCVTADGARWITECVKKYCPNAERCIDPFHVVSWATDALDKVRRGLWREALGSKPKQSGKKRGRPQNSDPPKEKKVGEDLQQAKYSLLKNPENLTSNQAVKLELVRVSSPTLYRAYQLKETLRIIFRLPFEEVVNALDAWLSWARRCRIAVFVELYFKIKRHYDAILATIRLGVSNARIEAINNKTKVAIRMAYGFRNVDNLIAYIMLACSSVKVCLPGRA